MSTLLCESPLPAPRRREEAEEAEEEGEVRASSEPMPCVCARGLEGMGVPTSKRSTSHVSEPDTPSSLNSSFPLPPSPRSPTE